MPQLQLALVLQLTHDAFHQRRLTLAVSTHEGNLVATFHGEVYAAEYLLAVERHRHVAHLHRIGTASRTRRELQAQSAGILLIHLDEFQLFEHLHAALHLEGLGVGALEPLNEVLGFGYHLLLLLIFLHLLLAALLAQFQILAVGGLVVVDSAHGHLDGAGGDVVNEFAVVTDHYHCLGTVDDKFFEPSDRFDVEVVGRLIEEQYIRRFQQQLCQLDAHAPSSRELAGRAVEVGTLEAQSEQRLLYILLEMGHVDGVELF